MDKSVSRFRDLKKRGEEEEEEERRKRKVDSARGRRSINREISRGKMVEVG